MFRQEALFIALIAMIALVLAMSGCTTTSPAGPASTAGAPTATASQAAASASAPSGPTATPGTYQITTDGNNVKITGNGVVKTDTFKLPANWYTEKITYSGSTQMGRMDYFEGDLMNTADQKAVGTSENARGTYVYNDGLHYPESMDSGTTDTFYYKTNEPTVGSWVIEFIAPPDESKVPTAPYTFTGTGSASVGPVKLPTQLGKAEISYTGPGEFHVSFDQQDINYDKYPSYFIDLSASNTDNIVNGKVTSPFSTTVDIDNFDPNLMLLLTVNAPQGGSWTIKITPA